MGELSDVVWLDLQPGIQPACEHIVASATFLKLVEMLDSDAEMLKIRSTIDVKDVRYGNGTYNVLIGKRERSYFVEISASGHNTSSIGEIPKPEVIPSA
jgi:hypothetical protein